MRIQVQNFCKMASLSLPLALSGCADMAQFSKDNAVLLGVVGGAACRIGLHGQNMSQDQKNLICAGVGVATGVLANVLGDQILKGLKERDRRAVLTAATQSLEEDGVIQIELPDSGKKLTVTPQGSTKTQLATREIWVDQQKVPSVKSAYQAVGEIQTSPKTLNVRSGPGTHYDTVASLNPNAKVHVFGKVDQQPWYLIGKAIEVDAEWGGKTQAPVAIGYVKQDLLAALNVNPANPPVLNWADSKTPSSSMKLIKTSWKLECKPMQFQLESNQAETVSETSVLCIGPNGPDSGNPV